ncbi:DUF721 domain-containing protein [bacterium]|nr:DUF721 domain-containing protein [bacterium]
MSFQQKKPQSQKRLTGYLKWVSELPHRRDSIPLGLAIDDLTNKLGCQKIIKSQRAIIVWEQVVGKEIIKVTSPISISNGILRVKVKNAVWRNELSYDKEVIRRKLNDAVGEPVVADIRFE